jgi:hypothetical protein
MGVLYIIGSLPIFYTMTMAIITYINVAFVPKNSQTKKTIKNYYMLVCIILAIGMSILTNGDSTLHTIIAILGILSIPGSILLQLLLWGIIAYQATTWQEKQIKNANGTITTEWVSVDDSNNKPQVVLVKAKSETVTQKK